MVIVRESPKAKEPTSAPQWPPRSPHEALLSSPSGRKKLERLRQGSPSPTPRRRQTSTAFKALSQPSDSEKDEDEDEDEETLQLKLQAIEAKLKLKKLQNGKKKDVSRPGTAASGRMGHSKALEPSAFLQPALQVPVSPVRDRRPPPEQKSPARVLLGIDKGLNARDVSLKRPAGSAPGGLSRSNSQRTTSRQDAPDSRTKSFSERIAENRLSAQEQKVKEERIQDSRSRGFGLQKDDVFGSSTSYPSETSRGSTRQEMAPTREKRITSDQQQQSRPNSTPSVPIRTSSIKSTQRNSSRQSTPNKQQDFQPPHKLTSNDRTSSFNKDSTPTEEDADLGNASSNFEPYSSLHLTKRLLDHTKLTRTLYGKQIYTIPRLLKEVKSPHYDPPDCETDYIVLGIVGSKSTPRDHQKNPKSINTSGADEHARPKFMAVRLTDLKWEIDMFLFDTGFEKWWKLTEGTVIAILNPGIMPPKNKDSGAFSLKVTSCEDTILEIGTARDLAFCKSIKSDGHQCTQWIDRRKTEVCEFHIALQVDKSRKGRMELNTMVGMGGRGGKKGGRGGKNEDPKREGLFHDKYLHETMYITPKEYSLTSASLLDAEDQRTLAGLSKKEAQRKRKRERDKEDELARKLGGKNNGAGSEYLQYHRKVERTTTTHSNGTTTSKITPSFTTPSLASEPVDAESLGLLSNRANLVSLSPVKDRKRGIPSTNDRGVGFHKEPMGWGGAYKPGLLDKSPRKSSMKQDDGVESPRKKARLLLPEKGIRTPGRESLGGAELGSLRKRKDEDEDDDEDDDLEIVRP